MWRPSAGERFVGMGCMRLSTERDRDEARAIAALHAAFDAGVTFLDTADAYCWNATETGHNERLIARAFSTWSGDRSRISIATKGGLVRPDGNWVADGRARHLAAACEASLRALDVSRIDLYQLHAPDPKVPLATSVRALASLQRDGLIDSIGLCNVNVGQIEEARAIVDVAAVQVELSLWNDESILAGVAKYCLEHGIRLIAYRPLGGPQRHRRTQTDPALTEIAGRHGATPFEIALAWLADASEAIVPIPGATRVASAQSSARAQKISLTDPDRALLDESFPASRALRSQRTSPDGPDIRADQGEVVLIMGLPAAGKSTVAQTFVTHGFERINRDLAGGSLRELMPALERTIASGASRVVLDNTYVSRKARAVVVQTAAKLGLPVRCVWLSTAIEEAQVNAAARMFARYGKLLTPGEMRNVKKGDVASFGPMVQFRYQRELEPPVAEEGFSDIEVMPFERKRNAAFINRALVVWCDGVLSRSRSGLRTPASAGDVEVIAGREGILRRYQAEGWRLLGMSWQPEVAEGSRSASDVDAAFARLRDVLGVELEVEYCPHAAGPPACWCRKPLPGLGVVFIERHRLDPSQCLYVGTGAQDPAFARRLGFQYRDADDFFTA